MTLFRFPPRLMVLQVGRSTSTGKSSEARSANGLKWSRVSSQARIKIPCPAQPAALTTIPRCQPLAAKPLERLPARSTSALVEPAVGAARAAPAARTPTPASASRPTTPALSPKRILFQHTFPIPGRPRAGTKQTKRAKKKLPKPKPKGDGKRPPATRAKDPETAWEARREYEQARNRTPERREYRRRYAEEQRQRAKLLVLQRQFNWRGDSCEEIELGTAPMRSCHDH